jgi:tRNA-specific 2-thiouridylase
MFTIGQRKGLPGGSPRPRYVIDIDPGSNRVFVGDARICWSRNSKSSG